MFRLETERIALHTIQDVCLFFLLKQLQHANVTERERTGIVW